VNTLVVGCGAIADRWVRVLAADPRVTIVALADPDTDRAWRLRARHGLSATVTATLDGALALAAVDVVVNLTPPGAHHAVSRAALTAGLHVLCEKPLALRLGDAVDLARLAASAGLVLAVMRNRGTDPDFLAFANTVAGRGPLAVTADVLVDLRDPGFRTGQVLPATSDLAVHAFDQIQALIAAPPRQVTCTELPLPFLGAHCALTTITVTFADASVFAYRGGYAGPGLRTPANGRWRVDGAGLAAQWDGAAAPGARPPGGGPPTAPPAPPYQACITAMIDALHAGPVPAWPAASLRSIAMLDAALTSAATGHPVAVPPIPGGQP
jgi:predicted dehydrogenase